MSLYIQGMSSCAIQEIANISDHPTPELALYQFCAKTLGTKGDCLPNGGYGAYQRGEHGSYTEGLGETYVFHGVERYLHEPPNRRSYAGKFADLIRKLKLGSIHEGDLVANYRYHTDHFTRAFLWNPDREAVKAWWAAHQSKPTPPPAPSVVVPEPPAVAVPPIVVAATTSLFPEMVAGVDSAWRTMFCIRSRATTSRMTSPQGSLGV